MGIDLNVIKKNDLSNELLLDIEDPKINEQQKNDDSQLKPLGDIIIQLEDIIPCMFIKYFSFVIILSLIRLI